MGKNEKVSDGGTGWTNALLNLGFTEYGISNIRYNVYRILGSGYIRYGFVTSPDSAKNGNKRREAIEASNNMGQVR